MLQLVGGCWRILTGSGLNASAIKSLCRKECRKPSSVVESWFWIWFQQPAVGKCTALLLYAVVDDLFVSTFQFSTEKSFQVALVIRPKTCLSEVIFGISPPMAPVLFHPSWISLCFLSWSGSPKWIPKYANSLAWPWVPWVRKFKVDSSLPLRSFKDVRWRSVWMRDHKLDWGSSATTMIT